MDLKQEPSTSSILDEIYKGELLHPNPTEGIFFLSELTEMDKVRIFDGTGRMVFETSGANGKTKVDLSHLEKGIYLVTVRDEKKRLRINQKVVLK
ncbi:MAG: T9SS type A sorting domain-containing protein [Flavobacteriales bacterium]|nr:T9SS type A sorting domain-containing protein [Flavobacteriales bacterium]